MHQANHVKRWQAPLQINQLTDSENDEKHMESNDSKHTSRWINKHTRRRAMEPSLWSKKISAPSNQHTSSRPANAPARWHVDPANLGQMSAIRLPMQFRTCYRRTVKRLPNQFWWRSKMATVAMVVVWIRTVSKLGVWVVNTPEPSIQVRSNGNLLTGLYWEGCQQVTQRIHL